MSGKQNREFISTVISETLLDDVVDWISQNMTPGEVFDDFELADWAYENGFTKDDEDDEE